MSSYPLNLWKKKGTEGPQPHSTPKKKAEPIATVLVEQFKQLKLQDLQQILSAIQTEMRNRQDVTISPAHEVSSIMQTLLKDEAPQNKHPQIVCSQWGPLSSGAMSSKPSGRPTVILH